MLVSSSGCSHYIDAHTPVVKVRQHPQDVRRRGTQAWGGVCDCPLEHQNKPRQRPESGEEVVVFIVQDWRMLTML